MRVRGHFSDPRVPAQVDVSGEPQISLDKRSRSLSSLWGPRTILASSTREIVFTMALNGEKQIHAEHIPDSLIEEKSSAIHEETAHVAAERGHTATDQ